jgi:hypothetical protein
MQTLTRPLDAKTQLNCQMPNIKFRIQFLVRPNLLNHLNICFSYLFNSFPVLAVIDKVCFDAKLKVNVLLR